MKPETLELLVTRTMPFGKYQGRIIADLPGDCYTVIIKGQERHLFFERADRMFPSRFGRWFVEV